MRIHSTVWFTLGTIALALGPARAEAGRAKRNQLIQRAGELARQAGIPACLAEVIVAGESAGNAAIVGHDENYARGSRVSRVRKKFLLTGVKYSGERFTPVTRGNAPHIKNDDGVGRKKKYADLNAYPDYGLDWRFHHGFGLGQTTFGGEKYCKVGNRRVGKYCTIRGRKVQGTFCKVNGRLVRGTYMRSIKKCATVPWILTPEGGLTALIYRLSYWYRYVRKKLRKNRSFVVNKCQNRNNLLERGREDTLIRGAFAAYGKGYGLGDTCRKSSTKRLRKFLECSARAGSTVPVKTTPSSPATPTSAATPTPPAAPTSPATPAHLSKKQKKFEFYIRGWTRWNVKRGADPRTILQKKQRRWTRLACRKAKAQEPFCSMWYITAMAKLLTKYGVSGAAPAPARYTPEPRRPVSTPRRPVSMPRRPPARAPSRHPRQPTAAPAPAYAPPSSGASSGRWDMTYYNKYPARCQYGRKRDLSMIDTVVIHEGGSAAGLLKSKRWRKKCISTHFVIQRDGTVYQMMDLVHRGHHTGNKHAMNARSVGVDLQTTSRKNPSKICSQNVRKTPSSDCTYSRALIRSLKGLLEWIVSKTAVKYNGEQIVGHREYGRHGDPRNFDWRALGINPSGKRARSWKGNYGVGLQLKQAKFEKTIRTWLKIRVRRGEDPARTLAKQQSRWTRLACRRVKVPAQVCAGWYALVQTKLLLEHGGASAPAPASPSTADSGSAPTPNPSESSAAVSRKQKRFEKYIRGWLKWNTRKGKDARRTLVKQQNRWTKLACRKVKGQQGLCALWYMIVMSKLLR